MTYTFIRPPMPTVSLEDKFAAGTKTSHPQTTLEDGILCDEGIAGLISALRSRGYMTQFSCQGGLIEHDGRAQVLFYKIEDAFKVGSLLMEGLIRDSSYLEVVDEEFTYDLMISVDVCHPCHSEGIRGCLWFPNTVIDFLTELVEKELS